MSNKVSVLVYSRRFGSPIRKAVMVYFAERASDNGEGIWASKATIANAVECGRSTVIRTINDFVAEGLLLEVGKRPCRNGETVEYAINLDMVAALDDAAGVSDRDRSQSETSPGAGRDQSRSGTPTSPGAGPKPSVLTIKEPSKSNDAREIAARLEAWASREAVASFIAYRRKRKGGPLTLTAAQRQAKQLEIIFQNGGNTDDALGMAEERGWISVQADWYFNAKGQGNGNGRHGAAQPSPRPENRPDAALANIARLAGLGQASGNGGA